MRQASAWVPGQLGSEECCGFAVAVQAGLTVYTGNGGFYHWLELPEGMTAKELNKRLFVSDATALENRS